MNKIDGLTQAMQQHNKVEKEQLDQILKWKWMIAGGIIVVSWIMAHGEKVLPFLKS